MSEIALLPLLQVLLLVALVFIIGLLIGSRRQKLHVHSKHVATKKLLGLLD